MDIELTYFRKKPEPKMVLMGEVVRQVPIGEEYQTVGQLLDYLNSNQMILTGGAKDAIPRLVMG